MFFLAGKGGMETPEPDGRATGKIKILITCRFIKYVISGTTSFSLQSETMRIYAISQPGAEKRG
jgi:hypothetical protein